MVSGVPGSSRIQRPIGYDPEGSLKKMTQMPSVKQENLPSSYRRELEGYTRLQDTRYKGYADKETAKKGLTNPKGFGDYSKKLQFLMKQAEYYNKNLSGLRKYSVSQLREAEGMYPEYGQYDKVHNSGWVKSKASSLKNVDGLSQMDKLSIGDVNPLTKKKDFTKDMFNEMALDKLIKDTKAQGGEYGPRRTHIQNFNKQLISHLKDYSDISNLEKRNDPISKLVKTQMENVYDRLEYLTDDKKLEELTGIDLNEDAAYKSINSRILGNPLNQKGYKTTWMLSTDHALAQAIDPKKSDWWQYGAKHMLNNPLRYYMSKSGKLEAPTEDFLQPFRHVSKLTQDLLVSHQNRMSEFAKMNPEVLDSKMRADYLDNFKLFGKGYRPMPVGANGLVNITNQRGDGSGGLHMYRPMGMDIIEHYGRGKESKFVDYKPFLKQLYSAHKNTDMLSPRSHQPYRPNLPLPEMPSRLTEYTHKLQS